MFTDGNIDVKKHVFCVRISNETEIEKRVHVLCVFPTDLECKLYR